MDVAADRDLEAVVVVVAAAGVDVAVPKAHYGFAVGTQQLEADWN